MKRVPLGSLVVPIDTWNPVVRAPEERISYIDIGSVDNLSKRIVGAQTVLGRDAPSRARQLVKAGDVLVSTVRPNLNAVALVASGFGGATASTGFCVLRPRSQELDHRYLFHWVKAPAFVDEMVRRATGASYPAVSDGIIFESKIPLASLPEQHRIADILDRAETLRAQRRQALAQLDELAEAIFLEMFGHVNVSPKFSVGTIRPYVEASSGKSAKSVSSASETGIPIYGGNGINGWATEALYEEPVLVFGRVGQQCGNAFITEGPSWVTDNAIVVRIADVTRLDAAYLLRAFRMSDFSRRVKHLDLPFINQGMILDTPIAMPPLVVQQSFAGHLQAIQVQKEICRASLTQLDALFTSLQHRAFRGEL